MKKIILVLLSIITCTTFTKAQWKVCNGPYGANVNCLASDGVNIFAGTEYGGVFLSANNTKTWVAVNNGLSSRRVKCITISGTHIVASMDGGETFLSVNNGQEWTELKIFAKSYIFGANALASNGKIILAGTRRGIFLSPDNGITWHQSNKGITDTVIDKVIISGKNILAAAFRKIFLSVDEGNNWKELSPETYGQEVKNIYVHNKDILAKTDSALYFTNDFGKKWNVLNVNKRCLNVTAFAVNGTKLYLSADANHIAKSETKFESMNGGPWVEIKAKNYTGLYVSEDNGANWKQVQTNLAEGYYFEKLEVNDASIIGLISDDPYINRIEKDQLVISNDNGVTWRKDTNGLKGTMINCFIKHGSSFILASSNPNGRAASNREGIFISADNGNNWKQSNEGITNVTVRALAKTESTLFVGLEKGGIYSSDDNGKNWAEKNNGLPLNVQIYSLAVSGTTIYAGADSGSIYSSTNNGESWKELNTEIDPKFGPAVTCIAAEQNYVVAGAGGKGFYFSNDFGKNWIEAKNLSIPLWAIAISGTNVIATTRDGINKASDYGKTWDLDPILDGEYDFTSVAVNGNNVYVGRYYSGMMKSNNNGQTWKDINKGITNKFIYSVAIKDSTLLAGSGDGVFTSANLGALWKKTSTGLPPKITISALMVSGTSVFAGTHGCGLWINEDILKK